jgi:hypothetical protein
MFMKTSGITAALPAQDPGRARAFYVEKVESMQSSPTLSRRAMDEWASWLEMASTSSSSIPPRQGRPGSLHRPSFRSPTCALRSKRCEVAACSSKSTTPQKREQRTALLGRPMEARGRGSRIRRATWSGSFAPWPSAIWRAQQVAPVGRGHLLADGSIAATREMHIALRVFVDRAFIPAPPRVNPRAARP